MINSDTRSSYFRLIVVNVKNVDPEELDNSIDLVLASSGVEDESYKFYNNDRSKIVFYFKTGKRKRKGQLLKFCERFLHDGDQYRVEYSLNGVTKDQMIGDIAKLKTKEGYKMEEEFTQFEDYNGNDVKIFNDKKNWHEWQTKIYNLLLEESGNFKKPDPRKIISLIDIEGNSGKSSFFKWMFFKYPDKIGRIGYGSASQLRSSVVNIGKKDLYVIDLARSKSKNDKEEDLLSVIEDLKSGLVTNAMYGSGKTLLMEPPHIVVSSNYTLNYKLLSKDRWQVYEILKNNKLGTLNKLLSKEKKREIVKKD